MRPPLALAALLLLLLHGGAHACTTIIVGRRASADGSVLAARNVDYSGNANITDILHWHAPRKDAASFASNENDFEVELPGEAPGYFAFPHPCEGPCSETGTNYTFEEAGVNTFGVAVSSTETIESSEAALAADPLNNVTGIVEDDLASIILPLPTATSARAAAAALGEYVEEFGSGEGFGVLFSDRREAWYLENAAGHHWLAQRIPDDKFFVSANQGRFQEVDFSDTANVMSSPGLQEFAVESGLWPANATEPFNFFKAFMEDGPQDPGGNWVRVCVLTEMYTGLDNATCLEQMPSELPVFQTADRKLGLADVKAGLRNYFDGTEHDPYTNQNPDEQWRPIFVLRTGLAHIAQSRQGLPDGLSVAQHIAMGPPALTPFVPVYKGLRPEDYPPALTDFGPVPDAQSLFWKARHVQALVMQDFPALAPAFQDAIAAFEQDAEEQRAAMEAAYIRAHGAGDSETAAQARAQGRILGEFTANVVARAGAMLGQQLQAAADGLNMNAIPSDAELAAMIEDATGVYALHGPHVETQGI